MPRSGDDWGGVTLRFNTAESDAGRCENGHGWPDNESAPHPYEAPKEPQPNRWTVMEGYEKFETEPVPDRPGWSRSIPVNAEPDFFTVSDRFGTSTEEIRFGPGEREQARALADERNRFEFQGPLDPKFEKRRNRLKELAPDFGSFWFEGPAAARWPVRPGRYLIHDGGVGWHAEESDELAETLADVEAAIAGDEANVYEVIDLDTGEQVPFERQISVTIGDPAET